MAKESEELIDFWKSVDRIELKYSLSGSSTLFDLKRILEACGFGQIFIDVHDLKSGTITAVRVP